MRLRPLTQSGAKQLLPVANKPIIHYVLEDIQSLGVKEVGVVVGAETSVGIRKELDDGSQWNFNITYIHQENPLGLAHCVIIAEEFLGDDQFVMYLGDNLLEGGIKPFASNFTNGSSNAQVNLVKLPNLKDLGVAEFHEDGHLKRLVEKPEVPPSDWALTGIYFFDSSIIKAAHSIEPSSRNELEITDAIQWLLDNGFTVDHQKIHGWWKDTGQPDDLLEANTLVLSNLTGKIDPTATVDADSKLIGEVEVGPNVQIFNSVVEGPTIIGPGVVIQSSFIGASTSLGSGCLVKNSEVSCSIIMEKAQILEVPVAIHRSLIGREAVVYRGGENLEALNLILGDVSRVGLV